MRLGSAVAAVATAAIAVEAQYSWQEMWTTAYVDNFNVDGTSAMWQQRYLVNNTWWGGPGFPIFFC